jgi:hypothetical protein
MTFSRFPAKKREFPRFHAIFRHWAAHAPAAGKAPAPTTYNPRP